MQCEAWNSRNHEAVLWKHDQWEPWNSGKHGTVVQLIPIVESITTSDCYRGTDYPQSIVGIGEESITTIHRWNRSLYRETDHRVVEFIIAFSLSFAGSLVCQSYKRFLLLFFIPSKISLPAL